MRVMEEHCLKFENLVRWRREEFDVNKEKEKGGERRSLCVSEEEVSFFFFFFFFLCVCVCVCVVVVVN